VRGNVVRLPQANVARLRAARPKPPRAVAVPGMGAVAETRWGIVQYPEDGSALATSLALLGEWLEPQVRVAVSLLRNDSVVLEVGAGVGIHALAFATIIKSGRVYAFEPGSPQRRLLQQNLEANGHANVALAGNNPARAAESPAESVDAMRLDRVDLLKVNLPEQAVAVLQGSSETLWRARPAMLLAAAEAADVAALAEHVKQFGYRCWHMSVPLFDPGNFSQRDESPFGELTADSLLAVPEEIELAMALPHCTLME